MVNCVAIQEHKRLKPPFKQEMLTHAPVPQPRISAFKQSLLSSLHNLKELSAFLLSVADTVPEDSD